ncbi:hypothetical protein Tco_1139714 [Tanacetum coccineum]
MQPRGENLEKAKGIKVVSVTAAAESFAFGAFDRPIPKGNAYGKCKHKIASIIDNTKDKAVETEEHAKEATSGVVRKAKKAASVAFGKAKETVYEYKERAKDVVGLGDTKEKVSEKVTGHTARESLGKTKDSVAHGIGDALSRSEASFIAKVVDTIDCELDLKQVSTPAHLTRIEA